MKMFKVIFHFTDGSTDEDDNYGSYYSSEEEARDQAEYGIDCRESGAHDLEMSNPGDYPFDPDDFGNDTYEIVEVEV
jgi:hypothetical protein